MRAGWMVAGVAALACASPLRAQDLLDARAIEQQVGPAVVFVRVYHQGGTTTEGTGFLLSSNGWIVTNQHVLADSEEVEVWVPGVPDFRRYRALVMAADSARDLALLRIDGDDLPAARLPRPGSVEPGMVVASLGYPEGIFAVQHQMRIVAGVVSHIGFPLGELPERAWIVSDVKLREGNSGGPLVDRAGLVVGVNTVRRLDGETSLSIPVEEVWTLVAEMLELRQEHIESWVVEEQAARRELRVYSRAMEEGLSAGPVSRVLARREVGEAERLLDESLESLGTGAWQAAREQLRGALRSLRWLRSLFGTSGAVLR